MHGAARHAARDRQGGTNGQENKRAMAPKEASLQLFPSQPGIDEQASQGRNVSIATIKLTRAQGIPALLHNELAHLRILR